MALKIYVWTDRNVIIDGPGVPSPRQLIEAQRGIDDTVAIQFLSGDNADVKAAYDATRQVRFGFKEAGKFDGDFLAKSDPGAFYDNEDADDPFYLAPFSTSTDELNALLHTPDGDDSNDLPSVDVMSVLSWLDTGATNPTQARACSVTVYNSGDTGAEGVPTEAALAIGSRVTAIEATGVTDGDLTLTNTSTSGSSETVYTNNSGTPKLTVGYANASVSGDRASHPFVEFAGGSLRIIDSTNSKYWALGNDDSNGMTFNDLLLSIPSGHGDAVLALRNDDSAAGRIAGMTFRAANNMEKAAIGWGNGSGTYPFSGVMFLETSSIFGVSGPTVASPISIIQTSRDGANAIQYFERLKFTDQGSIVFNHNNAPWPSQNAFLTLDSAGSRVITSCDAIQHNCNSTSDPFTITQSNTAGFSAMCFAAGVAGNKYVVGYGLSGVAAPYTSSAYHVSVGSGGVSVPIKLVQYNGTDAKVPLLLDSNRKVTVGISGTAMTQIRSGTTGAMTLGTITVTDATITTNSRIVVTRHTDGGTIGSSYSITRSAGVSFTITAVGVAGAAVTTDTSTMDYVIFEP